MSGAWRLTSVFMLTAALCLLMAGWVHYHGFLSHSTVTLWSNAIMAVDGPEGYKSAEALYPPLPFFFSMILHNLVGTNSLPVPTLFAAMIVGLFAALSYRNLRLNGDFSQFWAGLVVAMTIFNPIFLYVIAQYPQMALLFLGFWILAGGVAQMRNVCTASDLMKVGLGFMIISMSSVYGILLCLAALPFIAFAAPPRMLMVSPTGTMLVLVFPMLCAVGTLYAISFLFDTPLFATTYIITQPPPPHRIAIVALFSLAPVIFVVFRLRRYKVYIVPILALVGTVAAAMLLDLQMGHHHDPLRAALPFLALWNVAVLPWKHGPFRAVALPFVLGVVWLGGAALVASSPQSEVQTWRSAALGQPQPLLDDTEVVAVFLRDREGILLDAERHPELVVARGGINGLIVAGSPEYELDLFGGRPSQPYIVVKSDPDSPIVKDRLLRRFPDIKDTPPYGYALAFERGDWLVFHRKDAR